MATVRISVDTWRDVMPIPTRGEALAIWDAIVTQPGPVGGPLDRAIWAVLGYRKPGDKFKVDNVPIADESAFWAALEAYANGRPNDAAGSMDTALADGDAVAIKRAAQHHYQRLVDARDAGAEGGPLKGGSAPAGAKQKGGSHATCDPPCKQLRDGTCRLPKAGLLPEFWPKCPGGKPPPTRASRGGAWLLAVLALIALAKSRRR